MISLVLAESALETVPAELAAHPSVISHARKLGADPSAILLDNSWHYAAMRGIKDWAKRGRPDLVHLAVSTAAAAPLYRVRHELGLYVHTVRDDVIRFGPDVRVPKSYHRFAGLVERLYAEGKILAGAIHGPPKMLMEMKRQTFGQLIKEEGFSRVVGFSSRGAAPPSPFPYEEIMRRVPDDAAIVVGGFQKGHFGSSVAACLDEVYAVDAAPLEAHVVIARLLYEYEKSHLCRARRP